MHYKKAWEDLKKEVEEFKKDVGECVESNDTTRHMAGLYVGAETAYNHILEIMDKIEKRGRNGL